MKQFKKGDKVKLLDDCSGCKKNHIFTVKITNDGIKHIGKYDLNGRGWCSCKEKWELLTIKSKKDE